MSSLLRPAAAEVAALGEADRHELTRLVDADPIVNVVVASRLRAVSSLDPRRFGGVLLGARDASGALAGAAFSGGNLVPVGGGPEQWRALAAQLVVGRRTCTSVVGRADAVAGFWSVLGPTWGRPRAVRENQPLLLLDRATGLPEPDPRVRPMRPGELDRYLPAASAMFTEELGVSPYRSTPVADYRRRVAGLIADGRAFGIVDDAGEVVFKADLGAVSAHTCQLQGVWVRPDLRGQGLARSALAGVLRHALTLAPSVSLYVNDYNVAARRLYDRLGLRQVATLTTVLF